MKKESVPTRDFFLSFSPTTTTFSTGEYWLPTEFVVHFGAILAGVVCLMVCSF